MSFAGMVRSKEAEDELEPSRSLNDDASLDTQDVGAQGEYDSKPQ